MIEKLKGKVPESLITELPLVFSRFRIDTPVRLAHFLGQCSHESGHFKVTSENLNYSAQGLLKVFPSYFNAESANTYAKKPEMIASRVYGGRMGNGKEETKEGYKFRGRGYIQLTGKANYALFDAYVDDDILGNPDLVSTKYPLLSAAWFWHKNGLNAIADKGFNGDTIIKLTKRINGGTNGVNERMAETNKFYGILK